MTAEFSDDQLYEEEQGALQDRSAGFVFHYNPWSQVVSRGCFHCPDGAWAVLEEETCLFTLNSTGLLFPHSGFF